MMTHLKHMMYALWAGAGSTCWMKVALWERAVLVMDMRVDLRVWRNLLLSQLWSGLRCHVGIVVTWRM